MVTRLHPEPVPTAEIHAVLSDPDLGQAAKVIWTLLRISADPLNQRAVCSAVRMDQSTVSRLIRALEASGLARRVNGVWLAERPGEVL